MSTRTHPAVVTVAPSAPLEIHQVPTLDPEGNEIRVLVEYTASTPLDHHQASAHLLVKPPQLLGDGVAGTVLSVGPDVKRYKPGDKVFGFVWRNAKEKGYQLFVVAPEFLFGKLPEGKTMQEAVTLPNNFVTVWHSLTHEFGFELPWVVAEKGKPKGYSAPKEQTQTADERKKWILIWGGSSSVGMFAIQILKYYGYENVIAVAGAKHHKTLERYGAKVCFDYRGDTDVVQRIKDFVKNDGGEIGYIYDCIGSLDGSMRPVARIAEADGCKVAVLLPIIVKEGGPGVKPEYDMDVENSATWAKGVAPVGVRTHFWMDNKALVDTLQTEIMPGALEKGIVEPNDQVIIEEPTLLERAQKALDMLRDRQVSGGRLVWRIAEKDQIEEALKEIS